MSVQGMTGCDPLFFTNSSQKEGRVKDITGGFPRVAELFKKASKQTETLHPIDAKPAEWYEKSNSIRRIIVDRNGYSIK